MTLMVTKVKKDQKERNLYKHLSLKGNKSQDSTLNRVDGYSNAIKSIVWFIA